MANFKNILNQFMRYFNVALIGLVFDFTVLTISKEIFGFHYLLSAALGFITGLIVVYVLSERYVFSNAKIKSKGLNFLAFATIGLIGLGLLSLLMWVFTGIFGLYYLLSKVLATAVVYVWNFFARRSLYHG